MLQDPHAQIGQIEGFSARDIERVVRMYDDSTLPANSSVDEITILYDASKLYLDLTCDKSSSHATRSTYITLIIITLNICTHLQ